MSDNNDIYVIYTHNENGDDTEFVVEDMGAFMKSQEDLPSLVKGLEEKVSFQNDLMFGIKNGFIECKNETTGEDLSKAEIEYLNKAIPSNLRVIKRIREYLGWNSNPNIETSDYKINCLRQKAFFN
jgi:hypothetical protein